MSPSGAFTTASFIPKTIDLQATIAVLADKTIAVYKSNGEQALVAPIESFKLNGTGNMILNKSDIELGGVKYIFRDDRTMGSPLTALSGVVGLVANAQLASSTADFFHKVEAIRDGVAPIPTVPNTTQELSVAQPNLTPVSTPQLTVGQAVVAARSSKGKTLKKVGAGILILWFLATVFFVLIVGIDGITVLWYMFVLGLSLFLRGIYESRK